MNLEKTPMEPLTIKQIIGFTVAITVIVMATLWLLLDYSIPAEQDFNQNIAAERYIGRERNGY